MISYNPDQKNIGKKEFYSRNFRAVDTDDPKRIAKALTSFVVSPIVFKGGHRHTNNFISSNWIGLDFDNGQTLDEITNVFCDVIHVIGTTKSHQIKKGNQPPCDRFRVLLQLPVTITSQKEYRQIVTWYVNAYEADSACKDAARFFWPCKEITSVCNDGDFIDIKKVDDEVPYFDHDAYVETKTLPPWVKHWLEFGVPNGHRNTTCYKAAVWMARCGFSHDEIFSLIMKSPIPVSKEESVAKEVFKATMNGVQRAFKEMSAPSVKGG